MTITDYQTAMDLLIQSYSIAIPYDDSLLSKCIRMSENYKLNTYDDKVFALLHRITWDTSVTIADIQLEFGNTLASQLTEYTKLLSESDYDYIKRMNNDPTLSLIKYVELKEDLNISSDELYKATVLKNNTNTYLSLLTYKG